LRKATAIKTLWAWVEFLLATGLLLALLTLPAWAQQTCVIDLGH